MAGLSEIRKRIRVVDATEKITNAMLLVSTAKLKRSRTMLQQSRSFSDSVYAIAKSVIADEKDFEFLKVLGAKERRLVIVINSNTGLAGAYNINVNRMAQTQLRSDDLLFSIGLKARSYWKSRLSEERHVKNVAMSDLLMTYEGASYIADQALNYYSSGQVNEIVLVYTHFINGMNFEPRHISLMPIDKVFMEKKNHPQFAPLTEYEPNLEDIITEFLPMLTRTIIYNCIIESIISENASRRNAMDNATSSANDLRDRLKLKYNRVRQANITGEISEIVAGVNV